MKIYILRETIGDSYHLQTRNVISFANKKQAYEYKDYLENFIPSYYADESCRRACLYELHKLGYIYHWKDIWDEEIPSYDIEELEVFEKETQ